MKKTSCKGPLYKHLGHFAQQKWLDKGHNDVAAQDDDVDLRDEAEKKNTSDVERAREKGSSFGYRVNNYDKNGNWMENALLKAADEAEHEEKKRRSNKKNELRKKK